MTSAEWFQRALETPAAFSRPVPLNTCSRAMPRPTVNITVNTVMTAATVSSDSGIETVHGAMRTESGLVVPARRAPV